MTYETITYEVRNGVGWLTLNRPEVMNAFNMEMVEEIRNVWLGAREDPEVRVIVVTGAGEKAFCAGIDRKATMGDAGGGIVSGVGDTSLHYHDPGEWLSPRANDLWKPVIAAVNGLACGGAFYILGDSDIVIASENATFFDPHTTYGMAAVFEPMLMLQRMPLGEIMRISLIGAHERMSAARAHEIGFVQEVVPASGLLESAQWLAEKIASQPPTAVQATVRAIWHARDMGSHQSLGFGRSLIKQGTVPEDIAEGQRVFTSGQRVEWRLR